ncbi:MAG: DNA-binding protein [Campylobacterales bacterium]|nr:DNA-binding protein [Campylobacterales bacterium]
MNSQRLVTSAQAAKILNLSIQGIHYRIKNGQLKAIKENGKTLVYLDDSEATNHQTNNNSIDNHSIQLIEEKDKQIKLLKKVVKQTRKQYTTEIDRLVENQDRIVSVFQSEINLLQSAFNELKNIYKLDHNTNSTNESLEILNIKDFFVLMRQYNKTDTQIKAIILDKVKIGDRRFVYDKNSKSVIIYKSDFIDLI